MLAEALMNMLAKSLVSMLAEALVNMLAESLVNKLPEALVSVLDKPLVKMLPEALVNKISVVHLKNLRVHVYIPIQSPNLYLQKISPLVLFL